MPSTQQESCNDCGQIGHCPHMDKPKPAIVNITDDTSYDMTLCFSNDHIPPEIQMYKIDRALKKYFGKELFVPEGVYLNELNDEILVASGVLCADWIGARKKELPGV